MALDLRLQQKMVQQLVMTPQLQQAIKLLQLSHLEMAEVLHSELEQNPVLEEPNENGESPDDHPTANGEEPSEPASDSGGNQDADGMMGLGATAESTASGEPQQSEQAQIVSDLAAVLDEAPADATPEPSSRDVDREVDWEAYLETYSYSLPASAGGSSSEELPPFEANLAKPTSLHDHLRWQVQMGDFSEEETRIAAMLIEEINEDGYLSRDAIETVADELELSTDDIEVVVRELQAFDPVGVAARDLRECLLLQIKRLAHENPLVEAIIDRHLAHVEKRNFGAIVKDLKVTPEAVGEAVTAHLPARAAPGPDLQRPAAAVHHAGHLRLQGRERVRNRPQRGWPPEATHLELLP